MAVINSLSADLLSLRGVDSEYHKFSRFFRTRIEAENALATEDWVPVAGVINCCVTGDEGLLVYTPDDTVNGSLANADAGTKAYVDSQIDMLIGGSQDSLNTLQELAQALGNDPEFYSNTAARISALEEGPDFNGFITAPVGANVVPFYYDAQNEFPEAVGVHGALAHSHEDGVMYYAHGGEWIRLANYSDYTTTNSLQDVMGLPVGETDLGEFQGDIITTGATVKEALQDLETSVATIMDDLGIDIDDLNLLTGLAENVQNMGQFTGSIISDSVSIKDALQELETAIENLPTAETNDLGTFAGSYIPDNTNSKAALQQLEYAIENEVNNRITVFNSLPKMVHASWDASTAGSYDFANDSIASSGVSDVTRTDVGKYRVTFTTPFASDAYTVTCGQGSTDYSGTNASPREVSVVARNAAYVDVICERSDDAVNEDNFYMSVIVMG